MQGKAKLEKVSPPKREYIYIYIVLYVSEEKK